MKGDTFSGSYYLRRKSYHRCEILEDRRILAVMISEFMAVNESTISDIDGDYSDWIELANTGPESENLLGWYLTDDGDNLTKWQLPDVELDAGEQLLVFASSKDRSESNELHTNFKLSKEGEFLALVKPDGVAIEHAFNPEFPPQYADVSYGIADDGRTTGFFLEPTPGASNRTAPTNDPTVSVVINEIMYNLPREGVLDAENVGEEFIELHNHGTRPINLNGWEFTRGISFTLPETTLAGGDYLVVAANVESFQAKYPDVENVVGDWTGKLSNNGETIELVDDLGNVVDVVRYASQGDWSNREVGPEDRGSTGWIWSAGHDGGGMSLELINPNLPNTSGQNWDSSLTMNGTPGKANGKIEENSAPLISDVQHAPAIPHSDEEVIVQARLTDETGNSTARLHWRVDTEDTFNVLEMASDSDSLFTAAIPAHDDRTVIEFYVEAIDSDDHRRTWPAPTTDGTQSANALYQVMDEFDQDEAWNPEVVPVYLQIMTSDERRAFANTTRQSDAQYNATFIAIDGSGVDIRYNTGVRYRGSASRNDQVPPNRINIPNDRPWQGVTRINMNPGNPVNNVAGAALFRLAGVEMADARAVRMLSNGENLRNGLYAHVEVLDSDYAELHYPLDSEGNIYRGRRPDESPPGGRGAGLTYFGPEPEPYVSYVKYTNSSAADWSDVIQLTDVLNNSPDETFVHDIQQVADVNQWFRAFAMNSLIGNNENGLFTGDNLGDDYGMYRGAVDQRFTMIPYDLDSLFVVGGFGGGRVTGPLDEPAEVRSLNRLVNHPEFRHKFYSQYLDLIENVILTETAEQTLRLTLRGVATNARIDEILDFLRQRAEFVTDEINQDITIDTNATNVSGVPRTNTTSIAFSGTAPEATTISMTVNGHVVDTLEADRDWSFTVGGNQLVESQTLLDAGSTWRYLDDGSDQGAAWREPTFDDSTWQEGRAQLGYGDGDEQTEISNGPGQGNAATSYFRSGFSVDDLSKVDLLTLQLVYDDAAAVYVNGTEVVRTENLPQDADFDTFATQTRNNQVENNFVSFDIPTDVLQAGENSIAVEVHQASANSSDLSFDLELTAIDIEILDVEIPPELEMLPGMNRFTVRAYDEPDGRGNVVAEETIDVWFNDGTIENVSGQIDSDTTWTANNGPYLLSGNVVLDASATLTIEPGTTVFFTEDARLTIRGRLNAVGTESRKIRFTRQPGVSEWSGLQFRDSMMENHIEHAILEYGVTNDGMIGLENSNLTLDRVIMDNTDRRRIRSIDSSLVVTNSHFTSIFEPDEAPTTDNLSEHVWGRGIPTDGRWLLENNVFGHITGHNDSIDFDAPRSPNPIPVIRNNHFMGGGDDALDMTGDVWVEGNTFENFIKDEFNIDPGESNTISSSSGDFWVVRNIFRNVQHAALVKENAFMHFVGNTVVDSEFAPLYFDLPGQTDGPGRGAVVKDSLFANASPTFDQIQENTDLTVSHSFIGNDAIQFEGNGNLIGNPNVNADGSLGIGSFAVGAGSVGQDMGAFVDAGATVSGVPTGISNSNAVTARVGGAGIVRYRYQLDDGPLSDEIAIDQPIELQDLPNGLHTLSVIGQNELGIWQEESAATTRMWTVDVDYQPPIQISEILANNQSTPMDGAFPDLIELHNPRTVSFDLSGFSLTDDQSRPDRFVFSENTILGAGEYLTLVATQDSDHPATLGFALNNSGESLYLFDNSPVRNVLDSVEFGLQIADLSISRLGGEQEFQLSVPTLGEANRPHPVVDSTGVVINEWYAEGEVRVAEDFVELYNRSEFPADISGHFLSDRPFAIPDMSKLPPLSFVASRGYVDLTANGNSNIQNKQVAFRLSPELEQIGFFASDLQPRDVIFSPPQTAEVSMRRAPDGAASFGYATIPTPGATNGSQDFIDFGFAMNEEWSYEVSGTDLGTAWSDPAFDDSAWPTGNGVIGRNSGFGQPLPLGTQIDLGPSTFYFRKQFTIPEDLELDAADVTISTIVDDGVILYLNGQEVLRRRLPGGDVSYETLATENIFGTGVAEDAITIPSELLQPGENVFAAEVHQSDSNFDIAFGLSLAGSVPVVEDNSLEVIDRGLRITEVMYNAAEPGLDFIELSNVGDQPIDVAGVRLSDGINFEFPSIVVDPGQIIVVVDNMASFTERYGDQPFVVGEYSGNLSNGGETIALQFPDPFDAAILRFAYDDEWHPDTDGQGKSLEIVDAFRRFDQWSQADAWRSSIEAGGTPGTVGGGDEIVGDLNDDRVVNVHDIDLLCGGIRQDDPRFDLDGNGTADLADLDYLVESILGTAIGDSNLDGVFDSRDLVAIFQVNEYEDGIAGNSTWSDGDWNCDAEFSTRDLVYAFQKGSYSEASVPLRDLSAIAASISVTDEKQIASAPQTGKKPFDGDNLHRRSLGQIW